MSRTTRVCGVVAAGLGLGLSACTHREVEDPGRAERKDQQLRTLETISTLEDRVTAYAVAKPEIQAATVKIRPQAAIVLLSAAPGVRITAAIVEGINQQIIEGSGLERSQIIVRQRAGR